MRRTLMLLATLTITTLFAACTAERVNSPGNGNNANAANSAGIGNNSTGSREGIGPKDTGIGGTSEGNTNSAVKGNSNVEPTGVNKNAGR
ncbi:MAG TPA: hypothetical protein VER76_02675, partial [Pyrinomonadaceae bacterium]|nr:hypothetical protein [Pyrinomonadaceae bacterium]